MMANAKSRNLRDEELVSSAMNVFDLDGSIRRKVFPQSRNKNVKTAPVKVRIFTPDGLQYFRSPDDLVAAIEQVEKQLRFLCRKFLLASSPAQRLAFAVERESAQRNR